MLVSGGEDPAPRPIDELAEEITTRAAQLSADTCHWLALVAEFDARDGWADSGCRSCAHWVAWRCSMALTTAHEHVRVARGLRELPLVEEAFAAGELSYSKARALTRIEDVALEPELLQLARTMTGEQLNRTVAAYRGVAAVAEGHARATQRREVTWGFDDDGAMLLKARFPAEEAAIVLTALQSARDALQQQAFTAARKSSAEDTGSPASEPDADASSGATAESDAEASASAAAESGAEASASAAAESGAEASGSAVAEPDADASNDAATEPQTDASGGATAESDAEASASAVGEAGADASSAEVGESSAEDRTPTVTNADAFLHLVQRSLAASAGATRSGGETYQVVIDVDIATLIGAPEGTVAITRDEGQPLPDETARRIACDSTIVSRDKGRHSARARTPNPAVRRALGHRDRGCRFPGCTNRRHLHAHHIVHWARGGSTTLENLVLLCSHHHHLVHEGGYHLDRDPDSGGLRFARPDGQRLDQTPSPHRREPCTTIRPEFDDRSLLPHWCGEPLDLGRAVDAVLSIAPLGPPGG